MLELKNILYPTDFSEYSRHSLDYALFYARIFNAKVYVLHGLVLNAADPYNPAYHFPGTEEISARLSRLAASEMEVLLDHQESPGVEIETVLRRGLSAGEIILDYSLDKNIDLIVMGTHGYGRIKRFLLGSVAAEVVRFAPCPVLTCRGKDPVVKSADVVLAAVDFSPNSEAALTWARQIAASGGAALHVAHVLESRHHPGFYGPEGRKIVSGIEKTQDEGKARLRRFAEALPGPEVQHEFHTVSGRAVTELLTLAEQLNADLIVAGSQGFDPLADLVFGSTAEGLVQRAPCPVWTVKSATSQQR